MLIPSLWLTAVLAVADWTVVTHRQTSRLAYHAHWFTKPAVMLALLVWFSQVGGWRPPLVWFGAGLAFSLLGDVILILPERYFLGGVAAFLLAHLAYIVGFLQGPLPPLQLWLLPVLPAAISLAMLAGRIRQGLWQKGQAGLFVPVVIYALALGVMWVTALSTLLRPGWQAAPAILCSLGGTLFFLSDSLLVNHRFVHPIRRGELLVMASYHAAQLLLAAGVLLQYAA
jgi:alkenylglycerophosphocholine hydrolase